MQPDLIAVRFSVPLDPTQITDTCAHTWCLWQGSYRSLTVVFQTLCTG